jgi:hypothetical protein
MRRWTRNARDQFLRRNPLVRGVEAFRMLLPLAILAIVVLATLGCKTHVGSGYVWQECFDRSDGQVLTAVKTCNVRTSCEKSGLSGDANVIATTKPGQQYDVLDQKDWCVRVAWSRKDAVGAKNGAAIESRHMKEFGSGIVVLLLAAAFLYFLFCGKEKQGGIPARDEPAAASVRDASRSARPMPQDCRACELQSEVNNLWMAHGRAEASYQMYKKDPTTAIGSEQYAREAYGEMMALKQQIDNLEQVLRTTLHMCGK